MLSPAAPVVRCSIYRFILLILVAAYVVTWIFVNTFPDGISEMKFRTQTDYPEPTLVRRNSSNNIFVETPIAIPIPTAPAPSMPKPYSHYPPASSDNSKLENLPIAPAPSMPKPYSHYPPASSDNSKLENLIPTPSNRKPDSNNFDFNNFNSNKFDTPTPPSFIPPPDPPAEPLTEKPLPFILPSESPLVETCQWIVKSNTVLLRLVAAEDLAFSTLLRAQQACVKLGIEVCTGVVADSTSGMFFARSGVPVLISRPNSGIMTHLRYCPRGEGGKPKQGKKKITSADLSTQYLPTPPYHQIYQSHHDIVSMEERRKAIVKMFLHGYKPYVRHCWGNDEIKAVLAECDNWLMMGTTIIDSASTMWIMNLTTEIERAGHWIKTKLNLEINKSLSVFETTIRVLGGLLSMYSLSKEQFYLDRATDLAERLGRAFVKEDHGFPKPEVNLMTGQTTTRQTNLAEIGSLLLEFTYLSEQTQNKKWKNMVDHITYLTTNLAQVDDWGGGVVRPIFASPPSGPGAKATFYGTISLGAMADSFYEYFLKTWLLTGKDPESHLLPLYRTAMRVTIDKLLTKRHDMTYLGHYNWASVSPQAEHLACFLPGLLALGVGHGAVEGEEAARHLDAAEKLGQSCYLYYALSPSGFPPDEGPVDDREGVLTTATNYLLRPETIESILILWRVTHKPMYREWGWEIFNSLLHACRVPGGGYATLPEIRNRWLQGDFKTESYFFAETLKYLYLLFSDDDVLPMIGDNGNYYVLNTEAHPLHAWSSSGSGVVSSRGRSNDDDNTKVNARAPLPKFPV